jgi:hypothetical protein
MIHAPASRRPLLWGTTLVLGAALGGQGLMATPTSADARPVAVSGYRYVEKAGPFSSSPSQNISASCPRGKVVLAGGARIESGGQRVLLRGSYPAHPFFGQKWTASAQEVGAGTTNRWRIHAYAVCANKPAGLTRVQSTAVYNSNSFQTALRSCPTGTKLIGLGATVRGADHQVGLNSVGITSGMLASARAAEAVRTDRRWAVVSHAMCAKPLGQLFRQTGRWVSPGSLPTAGITKSCPRGTRVLGTGLLVSGNKITRNRLTPVALHPTSSADPRHATATVSELPGTLRPWGLKAQVICVR